MEKPERLRGKEALRILPFSEVAIPHDPAIVGLTLRTVSVFNRNCDQDRELYAKKYGPASPFVTGFDTLKIEQDRHLTSGGLVIDNETIDSFYRENRTFKAVAQLGMEHTWNTIIDDLEKPDYKGKINPGVFLINYYLDILNLLDPKVARFDDGVETIVTTWLNDYSPSAMISGNMLGAMLDDTIRGSPLIKGEPNVYSDKIGAKIFADVVFKIVTDEQKEDILDGMTIVVPQQDIQRLHFRDN